jgi:DNA-directed RNA polymerase sigma subunit (sigma70/sigma32)
MYTDDPVQVYLSEMGKVQPLTREQELERIRHIRARDEDAEISKKDMVETRLALVVEIARKYPSDRVHILDRILAGNNALMNAMHAFADVGTDDFTGFATPYIENAISHLIETNPS